MRGLIAWTVGLGAIVILLLGYGYVALTVLLRYAFTRFGAIA